MAKKKGSIKDQIDAALNAGDNLKTTIDNSGLLDDPNAQPEGGEYPNPLETEVELINPLELIGEDDEMPDFNKDMIEIRAFLKLLMKQGVTASDAALKIAMETQHPRAFEVLNQLMKGTAETALNLQKMYHVAASGKGGSELPNGKEQQGSSFGETPVSDGEEKEGGTTINQIIFKGTPTELQQQIKQLNEQNLEGVDSVEVEIEREDDAK